MMRRHPARDQAERIVRVRQLLRRVLAKIDRDLLLRGELLRMLQHRGRNIACRDLESFFREIDRGVTRPRGDVQRERARPQLEIGDRLFEIGHIRQDVRFPVLVGLRIELPLRGKLHIIKRVANIPRAHLRVPRLKHQAVLRQRGHAREKKIPDHAT